MLGVDELDPLGGKGPRFGEGDGDERAAGGVTRRGDSESSFSVLLGWGWWRGILQRRSGVEVG